ncbi:hypothetical protein CVT26_006438 [Gymnopilus dilepis]|uniref:Uncharacterized protein n=1 Tax=Gymnopilus dilepis TaxID=231916 RepID=A0A409Y1Z7_9AGAR|nr:hypothetical protein CVT26_006438 [Gymnopilus dilepis]
MTSQLQVQSLPAPHATTSTAFRDLGHLLRRSPKLFADVDSFHPQPPASLIHASNSFLPLSQPPLASACSVGALCSPPLVPILHLPLLLSCRPLPVQLRHTAVGIDGWSISPLIVAGAVSSKLSERPPTNLSIHPPIHPSIHPSWRSTPTMPGAAGAEWWMWAAAAAVVKSLADCGRSALGRSALVCAADAGGGCGAGFDILYPSLLAYASMALIMATHLGPPGVLVNKEAFEKLMSIEVWEREVLKLMQSVVPLGVDEAGERGMLDQLSSSGRLLLPPKAVLTLLREEGAMGFPPTVIGVIEVQVIFTPCFGHIHASRACCASSMLAQDAPPQSQASTAAAINYAVPIGQQIHTSTHEGGQRKAEQIEVVFVVVEVLAHEDGGEGIGIWAGLAMPVRSGTLCLASIRSSSAFSRKRG